MLKSHSVTSDIVSARQCVTVVEPTAGAASIRLSRISVASPRLQENAVSRLAHFAREAAIKIVVADQMQRAVDDVQQQLVGRPANRIAPPMRMAVSALAITSPSIPSLSSSKKAEHVGRFVVIQKPAIEIVNRRIVDDRQY